MPILNSFCSLERFASWFISWEKPRIALRGVRNSWLILARNVLLARLAVSAASLACSSSASAFLRSLISLPTAWK
nr:hypothetical protein [Anabaena azotica]